MTVSTDQKRIQDLKRKKKKKFQDLKQITEKTISRAETEKSEGGPDSKGE